MEAVAPAELRALLTQYPQLGPLQRITRSGLSSNSATCLFETSRESGFVKRYDPEERTPAGLAAEHTLIVRLIERGFPTPALHRNARGETLSWREGTPYALFEPARGEDRYQAAPVFAEFAREAEARAAGAMLARFHQAAVCEPLPESKPFRGLVAQLSLIEAVAFDPAWDTLLSAAPELAKFLAARDLLEAIRQQALAHRHRLREKVSRLPRGIIHGDFLKRNLFWQGDEVAAVIDFDLWNVGAWAHDLALAMLPCGFDWFELLEGHGAPRLASMAALRQGYESVRPLHPAEREVLGGLMEAGRLEFYLSALQTSLRRGRDDEAQRFLRLLRGIPDWFAAHPAWWPPGVS